jgi:acetyltransferase-like isoleucine patch superfamily enzyme
MFARLNWLLWRRSWYKRHVAEFTAHRSSLCIESSFEGWNSVGPRTVIAESSIGFGTYFAANVEVNRCRLGRFCSIGQHALIGGLDNHPLDRLSTHPAFYSQGRQANSSICRDPVFCEEQQLHVGSDVWVGAASVILSGITVGDGAVVAAGAVVTKSVEPYTIVGGVPAKLIKRRFSAEVTDVLLKIKWWEWPVEKILENKIIFTLRDDELNEKILTEFAQ